MNDVEIVRGIAQALAGSPEDYEALVELIDDARICALRRSISRHARILLRARGNHKTHAVEPLERTSIWDKGELPETYPFQV